MNKVTPVIKASLLESGELIRFLPNVRRIDGEIVYEQSKSLYPVEMFWSKEVNTLFTVSDPEIRHILIKREMREKFNYTKKYYSYVYHDNELKIFQYGMRIYDKINDYHNEQIQKSNSIKLFFSPYWDKALYLDKKEVTVGGGWGTSHVFPSYDDSYITDVEPLEFDSQEAVYDFLLDRDKNIEDIIERMDCRNNNKLISYITSLPQFIKLKQEIRLEKINKITNAENHTSS